MIVLHTYIYCTFRDRTNHCHPSMIVIVIVIVIFVVVVIGEGGGRRSGIIITVIVIITNYNPHVLQLDCFWKIPTIRRRYDSSCSRLRVPPYCTKRTIFTSSLSSFSGSIPWWTNSSANVLYSWCCCCCLRLCWRWRWCCGDISNKVLLLLFRHLHLLLYVKRDNFVEIHRYCASISIIVTDIIFLFL